MSSIIGFRASAIALLLATAAGAQEMEPRAFSASPIGTNFALAVFSHLSGGVLTDASLPITGVEANINIYALGYVHTFGLAERTASVSILVPYAREGIRGNVGENSREANRTGIGDLRTRFTMNFIGSPALTPAEFARRTPTTTFGTSLIVRAPTGQYHSAQLINLGSNRWAFKPEVGLSHPIGNWFTEGTAGVWLHTDNPDFIGGHTRSQDPIWTFQLDGGYNFRPGLWLSTNATYYTGGNTAVNAVRNQDRLQSTRYGLTFSLPLAPGWSTKFNWSNTLTTRIGSSFEEFSFALQYRWFDR